MDFGTLPVVEAKVIARVILRRQVSSPYYNLIQVDDYRQAVDEPSGGGSIVGDHGNLTGLGDDDHPQYLMYSGAIANLDMGSYTITTTGTVVGSNIPAPTVAAKVLTSTGIGTASWQDSVSGVTDHGALTGLTDDDHTQYVTYSGASGTVNLGAQAFTTTGTVIGSNIPSPSITDKVLTSTGANTATWQDPVTGVTDHGALTGLGDDDHTQYVTYSGASGTVDLGAQTLTTTGTVVGSNIPAPTVTDKVLTSTGANTATWQDAVTGVTDHGALSGLGDDDHTQYVTYSGASGAVDLGAQTLTTTGTVVGSNVPAPTVTDKVLTSTGADTATWQDPLTDHGALAGLGDDDHTQYVLYSGATGPVDLGAQTLTTTGTVVGSNIPTPTVDDQVLISTAAGIAAWSTAGNNQVLASDGSGNVAWEAKSFGNDIPANSAQYQLYAGTGVGTAAWTDDIIGLYRLNAGNITIKDFNITSSTGYLTFADDDVYTTGVMYPSQLTVVNLADGLIEIRSGEANVTDGVGTIHFLEAHSYGTNTPQSKIVSIRESDTDTKGANLLFQNRTIAGVVTTWMTIGSEGVVDFDNITINGAVISSDTGAIGFDNENLTTTGTVVGSNIPAPTVDDQVLISTASGVAAWSTAGNNQVLASDGSGNVAWEAKSFGSNIPANSAVNEVYVGTGAGTAAWTTDLVLNTLEVSSSDYAPFDVTRTSTSTNAIQYTADFIAETSSNAINGFGPGMTFSMTDSGVSKALLAGITAVRTGADDAGTLHFYTNNGGSYTSKARIAPGGGFTVLAMNANSLTVDSISIDAAKIWSSTGDISFEDDDLTTTGEVSCSSIVVANSPDAVIQITGGTSDVENGTATIHFLTPHSYGFNTPQSKIISVRESDTNTRGATLLFQNRNIAGTVTTWMTIGSEGVVDFDNITIDGNAISSSTGLITIPDGTFMDLEEGSRYNHGNSAYVWKCMHSRYITGWTNLGTLVIDLPFGFTNNFQTFKIRGYEHSASSAWEIQIGGYNSTSGYWANMSASVNGTTPFDSIRVGYNGNTDKVCVMLGTTSSEWNYLMVEVDDHVQRYTTDWTGWDSALYTDESGFHDHAGVESDPQIVAWDLVPPAPSIDNQVLISTDAKVSAWSTAGNDQVLASDGSGNVAWEDKSAFTGLSEPTGDDQALTSSAAGVSGWHTTCLADVLAETVPAFTGAEMTYVLTADSAGKFQMESAPWTLSLTANKTVYIRTTGNDTTGDGSSGTPFLTLERTIEYLGQLYIGDYTVLVDIGEGIFPEAGTLSFQHPFGSQVTWQGVSEQITSQDTASIGVSETALGFGSLISYEVTFVLPVGKSVSVGDYIAVRATSGGVNPNALLGCHYVSGWDGGSRTATVDIVYRNGANKASGTVTCTVELIKTVIAFDDKNGLKINGTYTAGAWRGLVLEGNYDTSNTDAKYGIWLLNGAVINFAGSDASGDAAAIVGFQTDAYSQNNAMLFADYSFMSKCGSRCVNAQNGGILSLRYAHLSGGSNEAIFCFNGSTCSAQYVTVSGCGDSPVYSYQGSFIDARNCVIYENGLGNAFVADRWSGIDVNSGSYTGGWSPATPGNNDGSYVIIS
jgi:hypothetical protein